MIFFFHQNISILKAKSSFDFENTKILMFFKRKFIDYQTLFKFKT